MEGIREYAARPEEALRKVLGGECVRPYYGEAWTGTSRSARYEPAAGSS
jgi:hypothetical protein